MVRHFHREGTPFRLGELTNAEASLDEALLSVRIVFGTSAGLAPMALQCRRFGISRHRKAAEFDEPLGPLMLC